MATLSLHNLGPHALLLTSALALMCCDSSKGDTTQGAVGARGEASARVSPSPLHEPDALTLRESSELERVLHVSASTIWPSCHVELEREGEPVETFELIKKPKSLAMFLWGCEVEAWERGARGEHFFAYSLKSEDRLRASDQRISAYNQEGELLWHHTIDRDSDPMNFASSRRSSFIVDMPPYLTCGGTRWDGSLEYICVKREDGSIAWQGKLPYWSGTNPIGHAKSITFADISTIKKIYPWEGVERLSEQLEGTGGYSALYATDGERYIFSPNRAPWKTLMAYDLDDLRVLWKRDFEESFDPLFAHAFAQHDVTLLRRGEDLFAIKTSTGDTLWRLNVGPGTPPVASDEDHIYILIRRAKGPNLIQALDPQRGTQLWYSVPPTGTLDIQVRDGSLYLKSVRSVQRAWLDKDSTATERSGD